MDLRTERHSRNPKQAQFPRLACIRCPPVRASGESRVGDFVICLGPMTLIDRPLIDQPARLRCALLFSAALLVSCASPPLAVAPPPGVDLSGHWKLDEADSDDPQRVLQAQQFGTDSIDNSGSGRRSGRRGGGGGAGPGGGNSPAGGAPVAPAALPPVTAVGAGLRWPGKELEIKQIGGVAAFTSDGHNRVYQPAAPVKKSHGVEQACGWDGKTLVVQAEPDEDRPSFEERYTLSEDGQQLIQNVHFKRGKTRDMTLSRVWDRVP